MSMTTDRVDVPDFLLAFSAMHDGMRRDAARLVRLNDDRPEPLPAKQLIRFSKVLFSYQDIEIAESPESNISVRKHGESRSLKWNCVNSSLLEQL